MASEWPISLFRAVRYWLDIPAAAAGSPEGVHIVREGDRIVQEEDRILAEGSHRNYIQTTRQHV